MLRLLVCGGRDYWNRDLVFETLDSLDPRPSVVIHGAQTGADTLADQWAELRGVARIPCEVTKEEWKRIGPSAGPKRNARMLKLHEPDFVIAFAGGRGTRNMIAQAARAGVKVILVSRGGAQTVYGT